MTDDQIDDVQEIIDYPDFASTAALVSALSATQEVKVLELVDKWNTVKDKYTKIEKGLLGSNIDPEIQKLDIRNRVRRRLGLPRLTEETLTNPVEIVATNPTLQTRWCYTCRTVPCNCRLC